MKLKDQLVKLDACRKAVEWVGDRDLKTAWAECERADWMLWFAARNKGVKRTTLVRAACACARTALRHVPVGEDRPRLAIEAAERWARRPTEKNKQVICAAAAASDAASDAALAAADAAARAASDAALAAADAAAASDAASDAALAAYDAAASDAALAAADARASVYAAALKEMAQIVRRFIKF